MGIFGAMTTAVSGLRAQSFALENISGNIANSQTTAYKRNETSFTDLVSDALPANQVSGSVNAKSRATNDVRGDIQTASSPTYIAMNGDGYFVVAKSTSMVDGDPVFSGTDLYTRRGDFEINKDGFLVNGAGYYLKMLPVDRSTGNVVGSVPQVMQLGDDILPARATTLIEYTGNLPLAPKNDNWNADKDTPGSELLNPANFTTDPRAVGTARVPFNVPAGTALTTPADITATDVNVGDTLTLGVGGSSETFTFTAGMSLQDLVDAINDPANSDVAGKVQASIVGGNQLKLDGVNQNETLTITGTGSAVTDLGLPASATFTNNAAPQGYITASDEAEFLASSISGGSTTIYNAQGTPVDVVFQWAKVNSAATGGTDTWNLFYKTDTTATGTEPMWQNVGQNFTFGPDSQLQGGFPSTTIPNLTVDGVNVGNMTLNHGASGITQFAAASGKADMAPDQDGYAAGEVLRVEVSDGGRITAFYSNGQMADIAEIPTVYFNADNSLKREDGGAYSTTFDSGPPIPGAPGTIVGQSLEGSNVDIADEFTKLIVTQQAYSANTRIVSTADEMLQEALNMIR
ncbi:flagellar hook-basal body complex protein [Flaviflagellibacter deserti]|uniref:Flagellar hook protein FlgE n=1 Tax=Flaviflagellibacter deserti TaxID=2267266 RepID=A0ABV9YZR9_9HYPH